jgi:signal transduction histidine kinase
MLERCTIVQALKLPYAAILLREDEGFRTAAAYGLLRGEPEALPLVYQREEIGRLVLSPRAPGAGFSDADPGLLEALARQAEVAVHAVTPTTDLQHSRERLVATREEERRRFRRDLHDGLGAQLAGLNVQAGPGRGSATSLAESHQPRARDPKPHRTRTPQPFDRQALSLSTKTVGNYVSNIFTKLQVADRAQAIIQASGV